MKKQDMIDKIDARFQYVEKKLVERRQDELKSGVTRQIYIAKVYDFQNERIAEKGFPFVVFDEGNPGEEAFWMSSGDPAPPVPDPTFQAEMMAWLESKLDMQVGPYIIRHIESITANNALRRGTANIIVEDGAGDRLRKSVLIWKDAQDTFQYQIIKE